MTTLTRIENIAAMFAAPAYERNAIKAAIRKLLIEEIDACASIVDDYDISPSIATAIRKKKDLL